LTVKSGAACTNPTRHNAAGEFVKREKNEGPVSSARMSWCEAANQALEIPAEDIPFEDTPQSYYDEVPAKKRK
jgi:hypothetical protein